MARRPLYQNKKIMKMTAIFCKILLTGVVLSYQAGYAQTSPSPTAGPQAGGNVKTVKAYFGAFEKKDWNSIQRIMADGFTFSSPMDDHINIKAFKERCWPNAYKIKRFDVDKIVVDGDLVFVITDGWTTDGKLFRNSDCFKLKNGKITADDMRTMNEAVDGQHRDPVDVVREFRRKRAYKQSCDCRQTGISSLQGTTPRLPIPPRSSDSE